MLKVELRTVFNSIRRLLEAKCLADTFIPKSCMAFAATLEPLSRLQTQTGHHSKSDNPIQLTEWTEIRAANHLASDLWDDLPTWKQFKAAKHVNL